MGEVYDITRYRKDTLKNLKQELIETVYLAANLEGNMSSEYYKNLPHLILRYIKLSDKASRTQNSGHIKTKENDENFEKEIDIIQMIAIINELEKEYKDKFDAVYIER